MTPDSRDLQDTGDLEQELAACERLLGGSAAEAELAAGEQDALPAGFEDEVGALIDGERGLLASLRALPTPWRIALVAALSAAVAAFAALMMPRPDIGSYPLPRMTVTLAVMFALTAAASWRLLRPLHLPRPSPGSSLALLLAGVVVPLGLALWPNAHPGAPPGHGTAFMVHSAICLGTGALAATPILVLALVIRRAHVDGPAVAALGGVAAGLGGNMMLQLACPVTDPIHVLVGHVSLVALLAVAVALACRPWRAGGAQPRRSTAAQ